MYKRQILKQIKAIEEKRAAALSKILSAKLVAPGSYGRVYCRCGKPNCWCSSGKGHPYSRIVFSEGGRSKTKSISEDNVGWIKKVTKNYRDFKEGVKKIKEYDSILFDLLGKYLKEIIMQTRDKKEYN